MVSHTLQRGCSFTRQDAAGFSDFAVRWPSIQPEIVYQRMVKLRVGQDLSTSQSRAGS